MHKFTLIAGSLAVAAMWTIAPAYAQTTTTEKMEQKAERAADKAERAADKAEKSADKAADKVEDKAHDAKETIKDKAVRAKETIKDKTVRAKDKMRDKMHRADDRMAMTDTRAAQDALKTQGFDPGPVDGRMGPRTRAAISDYQRKNDLPVTGTLDAPTMSKLNVRTSERSADVPAASPTTQPDTKKQTQ
jgi:peptidoglycan hydrolase-like protein with peptidoglycan-binding domain